MSGGKCPGGTCPGGLCPRTILSIIYVNLRILAFLDWSQSDKM